MVVNEIYERKTASYSYINNLYAIIGNDENFKNWTMINFFDVIQKKDHSFPSFYYAILDVECPFIEKSYTSINDVDESNILEYIKLLINKKKYVQLYTNEFFIPNRLAYNKIDYEHDNLIIGYDDENAILVMYGYSEERKAGITHVSYDKFLQSYHWLKMKYSEEQDYSSKNMYNIISLRRKYFNYEFSRELFQQKCDDFYNGKSAVGSMIIQYFEPYNQHNFIYGVDAIKRMHQIDEFALSSEIVEKNIYFLYEFFRDFSETVAYYNEYCESVPIELRQKSQENIELALKIFIIVRKTGEIDKNIYNKTLNYIIRNLELILNFLRGNR